MAKRTYGAISVLVALLGALWAFRADSDQPRPAPIIGKNNTVLVLMSDPNGLSNVHLATSQALLENHPWIDLHLASFPRVAKRVERISSFARRKTPEAKSITFHPLPVADYETSIKMGGIDSIDVAIGPPGSAGIQKTCDNMQLFISPWSAEDHYSLYQEIQGLVKELDPAVIVIDSIFNPSIDAVRDLNRLHVIVSPNTVADIFAANQPWLKMLWKYPAMGAGLPYPVPWRSIPSNIGLNLRFVYAMVFVPAVKAKRAYLKERGLKDPINLFGLHRPDVPWITQTMPEGALPVDVIPTNVSCVGPILISVAPVKEQDPELDAWLAQKPTVLVNLGSSVRYSEERAKVMAKALAAVMEAADVQILWKHMVTENASYDDSFKEPLQRYIADGRVKVEKWLNVDPSAILETGHVAAFVHHGGAGCYHEGLAAGVPHVVLPLWVDLYNFATLTEDLGIGIWGSKRTAPDWTVEELSESIIKVLDGGDAGLKIREKSQYLAKLLETRPKGRDAAAHKIARLAALGH